jgi:hypothetical protein
MWFFDMIQNYIRKRILFLYVVYKSMVIYIKNILFDHGHCSASIHKLDKNLYELTYTIREKTYKMLLRPKRGPNPVLQVNKDGKDITHHVLPYLGPEYNYHGSDLTPIDLGHDSLTFELNDGTAHTFTQDQVLLKIFLSNT